MFDRARVTLKRRAFLALSGLMLFDLVLMGRLAVIQGWQAEGLRRKAEAAHFRGIPLAPIRGPIRDRNGNLLAETFHVPSLYAVPVQARAHRGRSAALLATLLGMPEPTILRRLSRRQGFVWIKRHLTDKEAQAVQQQLPELPGVALVTEAARYYPEGSLAGAVVGFTGIDNQGLAGLEWTYNRQLAGQPGAIEQEFNVVGQPVEGSRVRVVAPRPGNALLLALDQNIQWMAEQAVLNGLARTGARRVSVVIMDPASGGILALAQTPRFDPNHYRDYPAAAYRVWAVSDTNPPGSIFKPVTLAAALEAGVATPASGYYCPGFKVVLGRRVNCWRPGGHGAESLADVVKNSCNVGFMDLGLALGLATFYDFVGKFGLFSRTGIDLPGEAVGIHPPAARATALDLAVMAFGQTLTVTPIALLNAVSAIANGGRLMRPTLGRLVVSPDGKVSENREQTVVRRVLQPATARLVQQMMVQVVDRGTGKNAQVPGYRVAGKTGTAQKVIDGRVAKGVYIASFVGFAPVPDPRVAMLVSVDEPQGAFYGGQVAAPIFAEILRQVLAYLKVPPTRPARPLPVGTAALVPNLVNLDPETARRDGARFGFVVEFSGRGPWVVEQDIEYGAWRPAGSRLTCRLGTRRRDYLQWVTVPDFTGLERAQAEQLGTLIGVNALPAGRGQRVTAQSIVAGTQVKAGSTVRLGMGR